MNTTIEVKKFYTAKYDRIFKAIFKNENDHHLMEALLETCLGSKVKIISYYDNELKIRHAEERTKRLDLLIDMEGKKVNVEINSNADLATKVRNLNYFTSFYSQHSKVGKVYDLDTEFIHIDLSFKLGIKRPIKNTYTLYSRDTEDNYVDNIKVIEINMDRVMRLWYDKKEKEIEKYKYLIMLDLDSEGLEMINKKIEDKILEEYKDRVYTLNGDVAFIAPLSAEEDAIVLENTRLMESEKEGIKKGINKRNLQIAKALVAKGVDLDIISESTGLSKEKLKKLKS